MTAVDLSHRALDVARNNARGLGAGIRFVGSNWFSDLGQETFDLIVSNPPYIAQGDAHLTQGDLRFEPIEALTDNEAGAKGLAAIRHIVENAPRHLNPGGWLLFEHGYDQAEACRTLLTERGFVDVTSTPDLAGIPRVSGGLWTGD
jgi:release factor glutamine methyltransferase